MMFTSFDWYEKLQIYLQQVSMESKTDASIQQRNMTKKMECPILSKKILPVKWTSLKQKNKCVFRTLGRGSMATIKPSLDNSLSLLACVNLQSHRQNQFYCSLLAYMHRLYTKILEHLLQVTKFYTVWSGYVNIWAIKPPPAPANPFATALDMPCPDQCISKGSTALTRNLVRKNKT